jgi:hypothetical protein
MSSSLLMCGAGTEDATIGAADEYRLASTAAAVEMHSSCHDLLARVSDLHRDNDVGGGACDSPPPCNAASSCLSGTTKIKKMMYSLAESEDFDREEIATYEEVARLFPRTGFFRPIVLVGPPGVGRNEIKRRVIAMEQDRFKITTPRELIVTDLQGVP